MKSQRLVRGLHLTLTEFINESRVLKQSETLISNSICSKINVAALNLRSHKHHQVYGNKIFVRRFELQTKNISSNSLCSAIKYIEFCSKVVFYYKNKNFKYINVHSVYLLPLGIVLKLLNNAYLIYDTHELETEKLNDYGLLKKAIKFIEYISMKFVDTTFVVSDSIADWYENEYQIKRPVVVFNSPRVFHRVLNNRFRDELSIRTDQTIILYQGGLMKGRGVDLLLESFKQRLDTNVVIVFMGYGELEDEIRQASQCYKNIYFYPAVSPEFVLEYTSSADVGIHLIQNTCLNHYYCMPNKIFEYAMAGLPVIISDMKDMKNFVVGNSMGIVIRDNNHKSINESINAMLSSDIRTMAYNSYQAAVNNSWEIQEKKILLEYLSLDNISKGANQNDSHN